MDLNQTKRVRVYSRPDLGTGEVLRVQESGGHYLADVVFQRRDMRVLETLYFLQEELSAYYPPEKIVTVKGGPLEEKIASCESFWDAEGAQFLISTSAGGEGINLQVCRILFNYDLPWNPMAVEQRIGRIHRYGQTDTAQIYNLVAEDTIEEKVYAILEEKLKEIAQIIGKVDPLSGEVTEDFRSEILGYLGSSTNYNELYGRPCSIGTFPGPKGRSKRP